MDGEFKNISEKCINCKYCRNLNIFQNRLKSIERENTISDIKIIKNNSKYNNSLCCIIHQKDDILAPIYETTKDDICENYECKYFEDEDTCNNIDNSSMYDFKMISININNKENF